MSKNSMLEFNNKYSEEMRFILKKAKYFRMLPKFKIKTQKKKKIMKK